MPAIEDDKTLIPTASDGVGARGDFVSSSSFFGHTLPDGTRIAEFEIKGLIGEGGFGIVYLAYDPTLQRHVALKEYMPASLAARASGGLGVAVKSQRHLETFKAGLKSFVNEARLLARFNHRSLVKVYRFWEANGTAYMVMPYYEGPTLKRALAERSEPPDEAALRAWLDPLLDALATMHEAHCFHRDIAPDNILLTPNGPLLLDFGAARHVIGDMTQALTVMLKPGYAPIEQYGEVAAMAQGAWTDLYALASVVYCAITGHAPMSSVERMMSDTLVPLSQQAARRYGAGFLKAIDAALALRPQDRPPTVAEFRALLDAKPAVVAAAPPPPIPITVDAASMTAAPIEARPAPATAPIKRSTSRNWPRLAAAAAALAALAAAPLLFTVQWTKNAPPAAVTAPTAAPAVVSQPQPEAAAPAPAPLPMPVPAPAPVAAKAELPVPRTEPVRAPAVEVAAPRPVPAVEADKPAPKVQAKTTEVKHAERPVRTPTPPPRTTGTSARCSDILQKASLENLNDEEAAFLRKECK